MPSLLSIADFDRPTLDGVLARAARPRTRTDLSLSGATVGLMFYSDSLRTRTGYEAAAGRLGAATFAVLAPRHTPVMSQPESVEDAVRSVAGWCDVLCLRHPDADVVGRVAGLVDVPVVNCGNGTDEHPTQALIDLLAISEVRGQVDGVRIAMIGDLHGMRSAHSLIVALGRYDDVYVRCIAPAGLEMPARYVERFLASGNVTDQTCALDVRDVDVIYVAGLPRHTAAEVPDSVRESLWITPEVLSRLKPHVRVLCPLPRVDEIQPGVDALPQAGYFRQSALGLPMRMAVLEWVLDGATRRGSFDSNDHWRV